MSEVVKKLETPSPNSFFNFFEGLSPEILEIYENVDPGTVYKTDLSPQTAADRLANLRITEFLKRNSPYPVFSEETPWEEEVNPEIFWMVDPLDGTRDFLGKSGEFSFMVALIQGKESVVGIVFRPTTQEMYFAQTGRGTSLITEEEDITLQVSDIADLSKMRILVSRFHKQERDAQVAKALGVASFVRHGSFGLKAGLLAKGDAEMLLYNTRGTKIWDSAPAIPIIQEAGGTITDKFGNPLYVELAKVRNENGIVATNGTRHAEILKRMNAIPS